MIINPKNAPALSSAEQSYIDFLQHKISLLQFSHYDYKIFIDCIYSLGQARQEIFDDFDLSPDSFSFLLAQFDYYIDFLRNFEYNDNIIETLRNLEYKMWGVRHDD